MKTAGTTIDNIGKRHPQFKVFLFMEKPIYDMGIRTGSLVDKIYYVREETDFQSHPRFNNKSWTFAMVRNPWDRLVSCWKWATSNHNGTHLSFNDFVTIPPAQLNPTKLVVKPFHVHAIKQTQFNLLTDKNNSTDYINHIGRFETLPKEISIIRTKLGLNVNAPVPHLRKTQHKHYTEYYNDDLINMVGEQYKIDIDTFNYTFK